MTKIQEKLINAYCVLVMAGRRTLEEVPETLVILDDGTESTIRQEVEILKAEREIAILSQ
jgi:hypothetical protein